MTKYIKETIKKKVTKYGSGAHVVVPKRHIGKTIFVLVEDKLKIMPLAHWEDEKIMNGKKYIFCEISHGGGTSGRWIEKEILLKNLIRGRQYPDKELPNEFGD